ncbi:MAG: hypothetical protein ABIO36_02895 [Pyrinomonadaceae bacterium]
MPSSFFHYSFVSLLVAVTLTFAVPFVTAQPPSAETVVASGSFEGKLYTNRALGFSILGPGGWEFYSSERNMAIVAKNREIASRSSNSAVRNSAANTQILFQAIPPKLDGMDKSARFSCGIERLDKPASSDQFLEANKRLVLTGVGVKLTKDMYRVVLGGANFSAFEVESVISGASFRQRYIATVRKNIALFFVIASFDERQDPIIDHSLQTIKFVRSF